MSAPWGTQEFVVLGRNWCHLCDELVAALEPVAAELGWAVRVVDVDADPVLEARWNEAVPVLLVGDQVLCQHRFDEGAVRSFCARYGGAPV